MHVIKEDGSRPIKAWVGTVDGEPDIESTALNQLRNIAKLPFIHAHGVAVMPDVHAGIGATVGSVIATQGAIIPAAVGVDIGCGMNAARLDLEARDLPDNLFGLRSLIESKVPTGFSEHTEDKMLAGHPLADPLFALSYKHFNKDIARMLGKAGKQLGTLGGGNHFIEICLDEQDMVWIMLHSGSRGIGNLIGRHFIEQAKREMEKYFITLPDTDLAYLPENTQAFNDYVQAVGWAQEYALENRRVMMNTVYSAMCSYFKREIGYTSEAVNCHHNYIEKENHFGTNLWVTRKGAIRARSDDMGIIPGSMGQRSYIVRGKGNPNSYHSCSHGAGRVMSRKEAGRRFTVADLEQQTQGVECRKDAAIIDEIPASYKDIDRVMENQKHLVQIVHTLKQVLCVKGG